MWTRAALLALLFSSEAFAQLDEQPDDPSTHWIAFQPKGPHVFVGFTVASGPVMGGSTGNVNNVGRAVDGGFLPAAHIGVLANRHELRLEVSTFWYLPDVKGRGPVFETMATYAYLIPLHDSREVHVSWPLRGGIGVLAGGYTSGDLAWFQLGADIVGVAIRLGHIVLDFHAPSFRYAVTDHAGTQGHLLSWLMGGSFSYVF